MNLEDVLCQVDPDDGSLLQDASFPFCGPEHHKTGTQRCRRGRAASIPSPPFERQQSTTSAPGVSRPGVKVQHLRYSLIRPDRMCRPPVRRCRAVTAGRRRGILGCRGEQAADHPARGGHERFWRRFEAAPFGKAARRCETAAFRSTDRSGGAPAIACSLSPLIVPRTVDASRPCV